jgi:hypothetical protein
MRARQRACESCNDGESHRFLLKAVAAGRIKAVLSARAASCSQVTHCLAETKAAWTCPSGWARSDLRATGAPVRSRHPERAGSGGERARQLAVRSLAAGAGRSPPDVRPIKIGTAPGGIKARHQRADCLRGRRVQLVDVLAGRHPTTPSVCPPDRELARLCRPARTSWRPSRAVCR